MENLARGERKGCTTIERNEAALTTTSDTARQLSGLLKSYQELKERRDEFLAIAQQSQGRVHALINQRQEGARSHAEAISNVWKDVGKGKAFDQELVKQHREDLAILDSLLLLEIDSAKEDTNNVLQMACIMTEQMTSIQQQLWQVQGDQVAVAATRAANYTAKATIWLAILTGVLILVTAGIPLVERYGSSDPASSSTQNPVPQSNSTSRPQSPSFGSEQPVSAYPSAR